MVCCGKSGQKGKMPVVSEAAIESVITSTLANIIDGLSAGGSSPDYAKMLCGTMEVDNPLVYKWMGDLIRKGNFDGFSFALLMYKMIEVQIKKDAE